MLSGSLEGHPGLESVATHPGLQPTLVRTVHLERGYHPLLLCKSQDLWLLSPLISCFSSMEFSNFFSCKTLDS